VLSGCRMVPARCLNLVRETSRRALYIHDSMPICRVSSHAAKILTKTFGTWVEDSAWSGHGQEEFDGDILCSHAAGILWLPEVSFLGAPPSFTSARNPPITDLVEAGGPRSSQAGAESLDPAGSQLALARLVCGHISLAQ
jgi:hypothetical protein